MTAPYDWRPYYDSLADAAPRAHLVEALRRWGEPTEGALAVDCGCGEGRDARYLLEQGFTVHAFDPEPNAIARLTDSVDARQGARLHARVEALETAVFPRTDVINASVSLFFCAADAFDAMWTRLTQALRPGGLFCGHLLGEHDSWRDDPRFNVVQHSRLQVEHLLAGFDLIDWQEVNESGATVTGQHKHWHLHTLSARKR